MDTDGKEGAVSDSLKRAAEPEPTANEREWGMGGVKSLWTEGGMG